MSSNVISLNAEERFGTRNIASKASSSHAIFSKDQQYRYGLHRNYSMAQSNKLVNFIMMNPSTADADFNDPTVARCEDYALRWGFGQMVITNIFALRATQPRFLLEADDPVGPDNDRYIVDYAGLADSVVCAWGKPPKKLDV